MGVFDLYNTVKTDSFEQGINRCQSNYRRKNKILQRVAIYNQLTKKYLIFNGINKFYTVASEHDATIFTELYLANHLYIYNNLSGEDGWVIREVKR